MDEAERALRYLRAGATVDLVGRPGSGRTRIADQVREALADEGRHVIGVHGVRAQRGRALGALLSGTRTPPLGRPGRVRDPAAVLEREIHPGSVVVVDDVDDLDPVTAGLLAVAHVSARVPMLLTRRPAPPVSGEVRALVTRLRPAVRLAVAPLRFAEVHRLTRELLGADVDPLTVARVVTKSGGIPGLVRALILVGRETGALDRVAGRWTATRGLWSPELAHAVEDLLADSGPEELDALAALADAGVVGLGDVDRLIPRPLFAGLHRQGLVEVVSSADGDQISLFPPLLAEHLLSERPSPERLARAAAGADGAVAGASPETPVDLPGADDPLLSRAVAQHWAHEIAARRADWTTAPAPATAVPLVAALLTVGNPVDEVRTVYAATDLRLGTASEQAELVGWHAVSLAGVRGDPAPAERLLRGLRQDHPGTRAYAEAVADHLRVFYDRVPQHPGADPGPVAPADGAPADGPAAEARTAVRVEIALARGRVGDAGRLLEDHRPAHPTFRRHRAVSAGLAAVLAGRLDEGIDQALDHLATGRLERDPGAIVAHSYVAALGLAAAGRLAELDDVLSAALTLTTVPVLHQQYRTGVLGLAAFAALWQGREVPLLAAPATAVPDARRPGPFPAMHTDDALVTGGAPDALRAAVLDRLGRGYLASGVVAAVESAERFGVAVPGLRSRAGDVQGPLLDALVRYADAVDQRDAAGLDEVRRSFEEVGAGLYAARARIARALVLRGGGEPVAALAEVEAAWALTRGFGTPVTGLFAPVVAAVDLSVRELVVVELHVAGLGTGDIATALTLSPRTVESHFLNAYRKIGVESRDGLGLAASTWLAPSLRAATHP